MIHENDPWNTKWGKLKEKKLGEIVVASRSFCNLPVYSEKCILGAGGCSYQVDSEPH